MANKSEILAKIKASRGYLLPGDEYLAENDPVYLELQDNLIQGALKTKVLPKWLKELMWACMELTRVNELGAKNHIKKAFEAGATEAQVLEAMEVAGSIYPQDIFPATKALMEVLEDMQGANI